MVFQGYDTNQQFFLGIGFNVLVTAKGYYVASKVYWLSGFCKYGTAS
jgi:hypothetical protein